MKVKCPDCRKRVEIPYRAKRVECQTCFADLVPMPDGTVAVAGRWLDRISFTEERSKAGTEDLTKVIAIRRHYDVNLHHPRVKKEWKKAVRRGNAFAKRRAAARAAA